MHCRYDLHHQQRTRYLEKHRGCMGKRSASSSLSPQEAFINPHFKFTRNQMVPGSNFAYTQCRIHYSPRTCPSPDQAMTTVVAHSDCKVSSVWIYSHGYRCQCVCVFMCPCACLIWMRMGVLVYSTIYIVSEHNFTWSYIRLFVYVNRSGYCHL